MYALKSREKHPKLAFPIESNAFLQMENVPTFAKISAEKNTQFHLSLGTCSD